MAKLQIRRDLLERARLNAALTDQEKRDLADQLAPDEGGRGGVALEVGLLPMALLRALIAEPRLTPKQRAKVAIRLYGMPDSRRVDRDEVYRTSVASPAEFNAAWGLLRGRVPNCELSLNGRWYPVVLDARILDHPQLDEKFVLLGARLSLCETETTVSYCLTAGFFIDGEDRPHDRSVLDVLHHFGLRGVETTPAEFNARLMHAERLAREHASVMLVTGSVITLGRAPWGLPLVSQALGTPQSPRRAVVEPELEVDKGGRNPFGNPSGGGNLSRLPFVRVFSLDTKEFVYADVDDLTPYEFDEGAIDRLHLPPQMLSVLERVFRTPPEAFFGDLIGGKHGGAVVLASGNPGVGKTLTAEVYAEWTRRPLYVLEVGELGIGPEQVELNLRRVFARVARWDAVLQFDECEIFLARRGEDLGRSAIVGIFLRLLDSYRGILFLTTNRSDALDHAVLSRVMLHLPYPDLDRTARAVVWETMLRAAGLRLVDGTAEQLAEPELNGRQIRNLTRLARILYPDGAVTHEQMAEVIRLGGI